MSEPTPAVLTTVTDHIAVLTLNRPKKLNPFSPELIDAFAAAVAAIESRDDVRCVVVTGAGRAFCAGADFSTMPTLAARTGLSGAPAIHGAIERIYGGFLALGRLGIPTIAAVNGAAIGGGFGLALLCDIRVVAEDAKLAANFSRLGIHSGLAITALLPRAVGYEAAAELLFTGRRFLGVEAAEMGFARRAVPKDEVLPTAMEIAAQIASAAPLAVRWIKRTLRSTTNVDAAMDAALQTEALAQSMLMQTDDSAEGIQAMLQRRDPRFKGT